MEAFSNIPREATKRACIPFRSRLEKVVAAKGNFFFHPLNVKSKYR
jgi:hypothetical protein